MSVAVWVTDSIFRMDGISCWRGTYHFTPRLFPFKDGGGTFRKIAVFSTLTRTWYSLSHLMSEEEGWESARETDANLNKMFSWPQNLFQFNKLYIDFCPTDQNHTDLKMKIRNHHIKSLISLHLGIFKSQTCKFFCFFSQMEVM